MTCLKTFSGQSAIAEYISPERELRARSEYLDEYIDENYPEWEWEDLCDATKEIMGGSYDLPISSQLSLLFDVYGVCPIDFLEYIEG